MSEFLIMKNEGFNAGWQGVEIDNDPHLAIYNFNQDFEINECFNTQQLFEENIFNSINQQACYNTEGMLEPVLKFEYTPYYSSIVAIDYGKTNMVQLVLEPETGPNQAYEIISSLEEGQEYEIELPLPIGAGTLNLYNMVLTGIQSQFENGEYQNGDYSFFNNLRIEEKTLVSTNDQSNSIDVLVYPNPSNAQVHFVFSGNKPQNIFIYNQTGQLLERLEVEKASLTWGNKNQLEGLFVYKVEYEDGKESQGKIVIHK